MECASFCTLVVLLMSLSFFVSQQIFNFEFFQSKNYGAVAMILFGLLPLWFCMRAVTIVYNWTLMEPSERVLVLKQKILSVNFCLCTSKKSLNNLFYIILPKKVESRNLRMVFTCRYRAISSYSDIYSGHRHANELQLRPNTEYRSRANIERAISRRDNLFSNRLSNS